MGHATEGTAFTLARTSHQFQLERALELLKRYWGGPFCDNFATYWEQIKALFLVKRGYYEEAMAQM